jgi:hypothetical protein
VAAEFTTIQVAAQVAQAVAETLALRLVQPEAPALQILVAERAAELQADQTPILLAAQAAPALSFSNTKSPAQPRSSPSSPRRSGLPLLAQ